MVQISDSEWEVMRVVWAKGEIKSGEIIRILKQKHQWSDSTIKTLIGRLVDKKALLTHRQGRAYVYQAHLDQDAFQLAALSEVLGKVCQRQHAHLIKGLLEELPMTLREIQDLQSLLEIKKETAVQEVPCRCLKGQCHCKQ